MTRLLVVCMAIGLIAGSAIADDKTSRSIKGWGTLTDPEGDCTVKGEKDKLSVTIPAGIHDLNAAAGGMQAPRVLQDVEGDFSARVKVTGEFDPGEKPAENAAVAFQSAGLLVWQDDKNYLRLERDTWWQEGKRACYPPLFEYYKGGEYQGTNPDGTFDEFFKGRSTWLRLERRGDKMTASYSHDGKEWTEAKEITVELPKKLRVGVAAVNTSAKPLAVEFEEFKIAKD